jgi:hypothetical protein
VATITVTPHFDNGLPVCDGPAQIFTYTVNPSPFAVISGGGTICPTESSTIYVNIAVGTGPFTLNILNHGIVNNYNSGDPITVTPAATTTYTLVNVTDANMCQVTGAPNLTGSATVTLRNGPVITSHPVDKTLCEYGVTSFKVTATGDDLTYQWFVDSTGVFVPLTDGGAFYGATSNTLSIYGAMRDMSGFWFLAEVTGCATIER